MAAEGVQAHAHSLPTGLPDGPLALQHYVPHTFGAGAVLGHVVIAPALGVAQSYYAPFASWLATQGWAVTTFDYSGHAASRHRAWPLVQVDLLDWAQDCLRVAQHVGRQAGAQPVLWLGHSVGAQLPGLAPHPLPVQGMLAVASGSGYWRDNAPPTRRKVLLLWWLVAPVLTAVFRYFPGKRLGLVGDLPAGVMRQWRRWCLSPDYALSAEGPSVRARPAQVRYPLHALAMADDEMMSLPSIQSLLDWHTQAPHQLQVLPAQAAPSGHIGHLGFFRSSMQSSLWPVAQQALLQLLARARAACPAGRGKPVV